ncbi:transcriptional regulator, TetR family [Evansella cellulosilytica DSM 2522]|uniref:Transcriptional regulator, TetR family n=2 Tax=Evansella TaxID=2837485 RepID=E6TVZ4_EVAC2|nr:transcriptional regulator, TetR family [Evansella cellulosilytica DSM 2522]
MELVKDSSYFTYSGEKLSEKQIKILEAAIMIISKNGFNSSRTSEIASQAGISEGTLFRYYSSKKEILLSLLPIVIHHFFKPIIEESFIRNKSNQHRTIEDELKYYFHKHHQLISENERLLKIIVVESLYFPEIKLSFQTFMKNSVVPSLEKMIEIQKKKYKMKNVDTRLVSKTIISLLIGHVLLQSYLPDIYGNEETSFETTVNLLVNGMKEKR